MPFRNPLALYINHYEMLGMDGNRPPERALDAPIDGATTRLDDRPNGASTTPYCDRQAFGHSASRTRTQFRSDSGTVNPSSPTRLGPPAELAGCNLTLNSIHTPAPNLLLITHQEELHKSPSSSIPNETQERRLSNLRASIRRYFGLLKRIELRTSFPFSRVRQSLNPVAYLG